MSAIERPRQPPETRVFCWIPWCLFGRFQGSSCNPGIQQKNAGWFFRRPVLGALFDSSLAATPVCATSIHADTHTSALDQPSATQIRWVDLGVSWFPRTCTMIPTLDSPSVTFFSTGGPSGWPCTHFGQLFLRCANIREIGGKVEKNLTGTLLFSRIG